MSTQPAKITKPTAISSSPARRSRGGRRQLLDPDISNPINERLLEVLRSSVVGQEPALESLVGSFSRVLSNLRDPERPALSLLLLGSTGVGKTETARALAEALFGDARGLTRINCEEYSQGHELAKLLGSPPGYVGFGHEPLLSQRRLDLHHRQAVATGAGLVGQGEGPLAKLFPHQEGRCLSIVLFDEIEKAHPVLWNALLGVLEGGILTLGDNTTTDLTRSIVILTSNVGTREIASLLESNSIGFSSEESSIRIDSDDLELAVLTAARATFPLEFLNRLDDALFFNALDPGDLDGIFDKFLRQLHERAVNEAGHPLLIKVSDDAKRLIIAEGTDLSLGARPLRRAVDGELVSPLSRLIAAGSLSPGDVVHVEAARSSLRFYREKLPDTGLLCGE